LRKARTATGKSPHLRKQKKSWKNFRQEIKVSNKRGRSLNNNLSPSTISNGIRILVIGKKRSLKNKIRYQMPED